MSVQDEIPATAVDPSEFTRTALARFERLAARPTDRAAVRSAGRELTYRQLADQAEGLATRLCGAGVQPGDVVAVSSHDRLDYVVGLLAVWKAGAVYLPLDPEAPAERTEFLLADTGARVVLRDGGADLPATEGALPVGVWPEQLAYLIHTSGTSGRPKGVAVAHGPLATHLVAVSARFGITADDVVLNFAKPMVDVAIEQVLTALTTGACLVLPGSGLLSVDEFLRLVEAEGVTVANLSAGYFHSVVAEVRDGRAVPGCLRTMISGSDRLSPEAAATWAERTGVRLFNAYGPTETVITATVDEVAGRSFSLGEPVGDRTAYILDGRLSPATDGELFLGGDALAEGYLGRPGATAEKFVPDPFSPIPGARMYRTGDVVRRDGERLEFVGRSDDQVKIRGFRIELGEVENTLAQHPAVGTCAAAERDGRLAVYLTAAGPAPAYAEVREFIAARLPEQFVPASVTVLAALPLTPGGKVDRAALPTPELPPAEVEGRLPRTPAEQLLAGIWADVLGVPEVGMEDNFFHLGGDSLTAVRVAGRVFEVFGPVSPYMIFDAPTLAEFAAAVQRQFSGDSTERTPLVRNPAKNAPLSRFQRGLWLLDAWQPGDPTYNVPWVFEFAGGLDAVLLGQALQLVVDRHESLRTTFAAEETGPRQVIHDHLDVPYVITDAPTADAIVRAEAQRPFDLATGPLLRTHLVRHSDREASLVLVFHHIVWDEGSLPVLDRELREFYAALTEDREPRLPELAVQYADYATWLQDNDLSDSRLAYWAEHLRDAPTQPVLPADHARREPATHRIGFHRFAFDPALAAGVRAFARGVDATPFMVLLAGLLLAVQRRSGIEDVVVGTPVSTRNSPELDALIGYFVNVLPLRFQLGDTPTFRDLHAHVRTVALGAYQHQDVPLEAITDLVLDERDGERNPLFQLVFEMHTADPRPQPVGNAALSRHLHVNELARFDLTWSVEDDGTGFAGRIEYDTDLFDAGTLAGLGAAWTAVLAEALADPDAALAAPVLVSEEPDADLDLPLPVLFERGVAEHPDSTALVFADRELTYAQVNLRANRVARYLLGEGVVSGAIVAVEAPRGADLMIALLGVLKTGAGYTLLDPELPVERRTRATADAGAGWVLTAAEIAASAANAELSGENLALPIEPESVACVMFTSGSTGRPKAVAASHRTFVATFTGQDYAPFDADQVWLQSSPVSWDAFGLELFGALLYGSKCVVHPGQRPDPETMVDLVVRHGVTQLLASASLFNLLADEFIDVFANLRGVFTVGERASVAHVAKVAARYPALRIVNGYGPVESVVFTNTRTVTAADLAGTAIPVGVPLKHKGIRVLDENFQPSSAGEIYATGLGLAHGYLGQGGATAERFVPDPDGPAGSRMYRTGDLGRWKAGGILDVTGRIDDQVKIRGFRVEPGEVAHVLGRHPAIVRCAVVVHEPSPGDRRLAAYVTSQAAVPDYAELREWLAGSLPDYLIPASVTVLDAFPLLSNGKLDRAALPVPVAEPEAPSAPASTDAERLVAGIWAEVLGVDAVGAHDNFFRLGGNSLSAVRVAMRLSRETGTRVSPRLVFSAKTVHEMAGRLPVA